MRRAAATVLLGLLMLPGARARADSDDPLVLSSVRLLASSLYVQNVTAICVQRAGLDTALLDAAARWNDRNRAITDKATSVAEVNGRLGAHDRALLSRNAEETIKADLVRRPSIDAFCRELPARISSGDIDLAKRPELADDVRRVMAAPGPAS